ncbi:tetratricopeptide repeat protein 33 isoform X1 [Ambystoma mexicanum]|uniref:tetratricopeptide repeat protein 33 isoform X1 n=1 Tax=Ambystoma mexicanum TaxID=8296 RepID=UPI0037E9B350
MASFGWKRKVGEKVSKTTSKQFEAEAADEGLLVDSENVDWVSAIKRKKEVLQEDNTVKSKRLKDEGILMAENERYREAVQKWDEALHLTPEDAALYEMKSQVLLCLQEMFPAVQTANLAIARNPLCWEAWQTLGRAQLGLGEITLAVRSFQVALHIFPSNRELWEEDLSWARQLLEKKMAAEKAELPGGESKGAALEVIPDYDFESDEIVEVCAAIAQKHKSAQADDKTVVIMSASGTVETRTEKEENASTPDKNIFIKAK